MSHARAVALAWTLGLTLDIYLNQSTHMPAPLWAVAVEIVVLGGFGLWQTLTHPEDWRDSLIWPVFLFAVLPISWLSVNMLSPVTAFAPLVIPLVLLMAFELARILDTPFRKIPSLFAALVLVPLSCIGARYSTLWLAETLNPVDRIVDQLQRPFLDMMARRDTPDQPPVILLVVDTLRWDHAIQMRSWKRLSQRGATWERAMATASWTVPSVGSMFTGLMPAKHGAGSIPGQNNAFTNLDPEITTIATELNGRGWQTAGFVANPLLSRSLRFNGGFDVFSNPDDLPPHPLALAGNPGPDLYDGAWLVDHATDWLSDAPDGGWMLWVHLFDPHVPYEHMPADHPTGRLRSREDLVAVPEHLRDAAKEAYAIEVEYTDVLVERFLDTLDAQNFWEDGTLIFVSDHGEEFWEHGGAEHGHSHHGEVVDVALAVVSPGLSPGPRPGIPSLVDVHGTIAAVVGLESQGTDLRADLPADRTVLAAGNLYGADERSARRQSLRVILTPEEDAERVHTYDIATDPREQRPLVVEPETPLHATRAELVDAAKSVLTAAEGRDPTIMNARLLKELGYVEDDE